MGGFGRGIKDRSGELQLPHDQRVREGKAGGRKAGQGAGAATLGEVEGCAG